MMVSEVLSSGGVEFIFLFFGVQRSTYGYIIIVRRGALLTYDANIGPWSLMAPSVCSSIRPLLSWLSLCLEKGEDALLLTHAARRQVYVRIHCDIR